MLFGFDDELQAKECKQSLDSGKVKEILSESLQRDTALLIYFRLLTSRTVR